MAKLTYANRSYYNFIEDFIDDPTAVGRTDVVYNGTDFGLFDNRVFRNSNAPERKYQALLAQANYRPWTRLSIEGHWTLQLKNDGNSRRSFVPCKRTLYPVESGAGARSTGETGRFIISTVE